jgi:predicted DsbA family dithiol-disulfide isomerase
MEIEIWSDVMCPFCYIGKRRFEHALQQFAHKNEVKITWKSFQLDPEMKTNPGKSVNEYLAERKGWTIDYARQAHERVTSMAKEVGLHYDFDKAIVANSFDAHRLTHFAKMQGVQDQVEEKLFSAYFTHGKNIADHDVLAEIGSQAGLDPSEIKKMLESDLHREDVDQDIYEAYQLGISAVPNFVIDRKYGISGAQPTEVFLETLNKIQSMY